ncbi:MAG: STAS domain-containing protein [Acidimicrobiia bacterium]
MEPEGFSAVWIDGKDRLALRGELDRFGARMLLAAFAARPVAEDLVLDLTELTFIDAGGLGALVRLNRELHGRGRRLELAGPAANVRRVLAVTGLDRAFGLAEADTDAEADAGATPTTWSGAP